MFKTEAHNIELGKEQKLALHYKIPYSVLAFKETIFL